MHDLRNVLDALWIVFVAYWAISARDTKRTARADTEPAATASLVAVGAGAILLFAQSIHVGRLDHTSTGDTDVRHVVGVALTAAGIGFAIWARRILGRNWSGRVEVKQDHSLIRTGPYRLIRHPIYTGLLIALAGTAIYFGEWRSWLAFALFVVGLWLKARR